MIKKSTGTKVPVLKPVKTTVSGMKDTAERARRPRRRIWSIGHWRGHSRAHGPKPPTFVAHGVVVHGPDSNSNFARCVLRIRPSHWRPRISLKALLSHMSSTAGTAKLRAVALDRCRPALARAVDPPKQARLPCSVLWADCPGHGLLTDLRCWPRRAQPRPCLGPHGAGGHRPAAATQGDAGQHRALLCEYPRGLRCFSGQ
jgi:hypothetical protein